MCIMSSNKFAISMNGGYLCPEQGFYCRYWDPRGSSGGYCIATSCKSLQQQVERDASRVPRPLPQDPWDWCELRQVWCKYLDEKGNCAVLKCVFSD